MRIEKFLFLALAAMLISLPLSAQTLKFGHVDLEQVLLQMPEYKNIETVLDAETSKLESQFTSMREELQKVEAEYTQNVNTYTVAQRQAKEQQYSEMQEKVQAFFTNAQESLKQKQQELQMPVLEKLNRTIDVVGAEGGFIYIFEVKSGLAIFHSTQSVDVTPQVKAKLGIK